MSKPFEDLLKDSSQSFEDGNYFLVTITELELGSAYPIQFKWKYKDGSLGKDWSAVYNLNTPIKTNPADPSLPSNNVVGGAGFIKVTWDGNDASNNPLQNIDRVDIHISGSSFGDGTKPSGSFKVAGTQTFTAEPGIYIVQLKAVTINGATSFFSTARTVTVTALGEVIQSPTNPNGFTSKRILAGIEVSWAGTYSNSTFTGFEAIKIYAGTSASATVGTYTEVGVLTGNNVKNTIVIPVDGTYVAYGQATYIHAAAVNKNGTVGTIQANVTNQLLGPGKATDVDINDGAVVISKLAADVLTVGNLKAGDINSTSFIRAGTSGSARVEISSSTVGSVLPGLTVYNSAGTQLLRAPLTGGLTVTGSLTATEISTSSGNFSVSTGGVLTAKSADIDGTIKATAGYIGGTTSGIYIAAGAIQNDVSGSQFKLDNTGKARFGSSSGNAIIIDPTAGNGGYYIYHTSGGQSGSSSGIFSVSTAGNLVSTSGQIGGWTIGPTTLTGGSTSLSNNGNITITSGTKTTTIKNDATISLADTSSDWSSNPGLLISATNLFSQPIRTDLSAGAIRLYNGNTLTNFSTIESASGAGGEVQGSLLLNSNVNAIHLFGVNQGSGSIYANRSIFVGFGSVFNPRLDLGNGTTRLFSDGTINAPSIGVTNNAPSTAQNTYPHYIVITSAGNFREYYVSSSIRYKENINSIDIDDMYTTVTSLNPVTYNFKQEFLSEDDQYGIKQWGLIAEEVKEVDLTGELVVHKDDKPETVRYEILPTYIIGAIKSMANKIKNLQDRLDALDG